MSLTIELPEEQEVRLAAKANLAGVDPATFVERIISVALSGPGLEEILAPVHEAFIASGMSEDDLSELLINAKKQMRHERRLRVVK